MAGNDRNTELCRASKDGTGDDITARKRKGDRWQGIPMEEREHIRAAMKSLAAVGRALDPQEIYQRLVQSDAERKDSERKQMANIQAFQVNRRRERIDRAFRQIARVRDLLGHIGDDAPEFEYFEADVYAMFARAALVEAGAELEEVLFECGVYGGCVPDASKPEGWFAGFFESVDSEPAAATG